MGTWEGVPDDRYHFSSFSIFSKLRCGMQSIQPGVFVYFHSLSRLMVHFSLFPAASHVVIIGTCTVMSEMALSELVLACIVG